VRDDQLAVAEDRPQRLAGLAQVGALLGRGSTLARSDQRVPAERYY